MNETYTENFKGRDNLDDLGVEGRVTLKRILEKIGWEEVDQIQRESCMHFVDGFELRVQ